MRHIQFVIFIVVLFSFSCGGDKGDDPPRPLVSTHLMQRAAASGDVSAKPFFPGGVMAAVLAAEPDEVAAGGPLFSLAYSSPYPTLESFFFKHEHLAKQAVSQILQIGRMIPNWVNAVTAYETAFRNVDVQIQQWAKTHGHHPDVKALYLRHKLLGELTFGHSTRALSNHYLAYPLLVDVGKMHSQNYPINTDPVASRAAFLLFDRQVAMATAGEDLETQVMGNTVVLHGFLTDPTFLPGSPRPTHLEGLTLAEAQAADAFVTVHRQFEAAVSNAAALFIQIQQVQAEAAIEALKMSRQAEARLLGLLPAMKTKVTAGQLEQSVYAMALISYEALALKNDQYAPIVAHLENRVAGRPKLAQSTAPMNSSMDLLGNGDFVLQVAPIAGQGGFFSSLAQKLKSGAQAVGSAIKTGAAMAVTGVKTTANVTLAAIDVTASSVAHALSGPDQESTLSYVKKEILREWRKPWDQVGARAKQNVMESDVGKTARAVKKVVVKAGAVTHKVVQKVVAAPIQLADVVTDYGSQMATHIYFGQPVNWAQTHQRVTQTLLDPNVSLDKVLKSNTEANQWLGPVGSMAVGVMVPGLSLGNDFATLLSDNTTAAEKGLSSVGVVTAFMGGAFNGQNTKTAVTMARKGLVKNTTDITGTVAKFCASKGFAKGKQLLKATGQFLKPPYSAIGVKQFVGGLKEKIATGKLAIQEAMRNPKVFSQNMYNLIQKKSGDYVHKKTASMASRLQTFSAGLKQKTEAGIKTLMDKLNAGKKGLRADLKNVITGQNFSAARTGGGHGFWNDLATHLDFKGGQTGGWSHLTDFIDTKATQFLDAELQTAILHNVMPFKNTLSTPTVQQNLNSAVKPLGLSLENKPPSWLSQLVDRKLNRLADDLLAAEDTLTATDPHGNFIKTVQTMLNSPQVQISQFQIAHTAKQTAQTQTAQTQIAPHGQQIGQCNLSRQKKCEQAAEATYTTQSLECQHANASDKCDSEACKLTAAQTKFAAFSNCAQVNHCTGKEHLNALKYFRCKNWVLQNLTEAMKTNGLGQCKDAMLYVNTTCVKPGGCQLEAAKTCIQKAEAYNKGENQKCYQGFATDDCQKNTCLSYSSAVFLKTMANCLANNGCDKHWNGKTAQKYDQESVRYMQMHRRDRDTNCTGKQTPDAQPQQHAQTTDTFNLTPFKPPISRPKSGCAGKPCTSTHTDCAIDIPNWFPNCVEQMTNQYPTEFRSRNSAFVRYYCSYLLSQTQYQAAMTLEQNHQCTARYGGFYGKRWHGETTASLQCGQSHFSKRAQLMFSILKKKSHDELYFKEQGKQRALYDKNCKNLKSKNVKRF